MGLRPQLLCSAVVQRRRTQIVYGWMTRSLKPIPMQNDGWCGNLTLPREITLVRRRSAHRSGCEMDGLREKHHRFRHKSHLVSMASRPLLMMLKPWKSK